MRKVTIPYTDLEVSAICMGTGEIGSSINTSDSFQLLDLFLEKGGTVIDTAHSYGDWAPGERSVSEKTIGRWMRDRKNRSDVVISTKGCDPIIGDTAHRSRFTREEILSDLNDSLKCLNTDVIDFYWVHKDEPAVPVDIIIETLNEQVKAGKIRYFGLSNWSVSRMRDAERYAQVHGLQSFLGDQVFWNAAALVDRPYHSQQCEWMNQERFAYHLATGTVVFAYQSQAFGIFSRLLSGTIENMNPYFRSFYNEPETMVRLERMKKVMAETGYSITQVVLGYLTGQPFTTIPIVGCRKVKHLLDTVFSADAKLSYSQIGFIEKGLTSIEY